ncbi:transposase (plasmid) [Candidatus Megaera polyxenophila]|uniref:transposase n=1 Tax=Candidatus Megaera polyxenophila TaxID=988779 RepID=UPI00249E4277|nr:transposase [Candidatus Megaera polyxenophila]
MTLLHYTNSFLLGNSYVGYLIGGLIATKKNLVVGIFTALHTFGRDLKRNVHIHLSVTCGGINSKGKWQKLFFPAEPIKKCGDIESLSYFAFNISQVI